MTWPATNDWTEDASGVGDSEAASAAVAIADAEGAGAGDPVGADRAPAHPAISAPETTMPPMPRMSDLGATGRHPAITC
jgi:hypothetical protein